MLGIITNIVEIIAYSCIIVWILHSMKKDKDDK